LIPDTAAAAGFAGPYIAYYGTNLSPALLGVGYIVGLNVGIVSLAGAMISWNIAIPVYAAHFLSFDPDLAGAAANLSAEELAGFLWSKRIRYLGVGALLVGGIWTLISLRHSLASGVRSGLAAARASASGRASTMARRACSLMLTYALVAPAGATAARGGGGIDSGEAAGRRARSDSSAMGIGSAPSRAPTLTPQRAACHRLFKRARARSRLRDM
jgi:putative OPT family oligopeptide transporter